MEVNEIFDAQIELGSKWLTEEKKTLISKEDYLTSMFSQVPQRTFYSQEVTHRTHQKTSKKIFHFSEKTHEFNLVPGKNFQKIF